MNKDLFQKTTITGPGKEIIIYTPVDTEELLVDINKAFLKEHGFGDEFVTVTIENGNRTEVIGVGPDKSTLTYTGAILDAITETDRKPNPPIKGFPTPPPQPFVSSDNICYGIDTAKRETLIETLTNEIVKVINKFTGNDVCQKKTQEVAKEPLEASIEQPLDKYRCKYKPYCPPFADNVYYD